MTIETFENILAETLLGNIRDKNARVKHETGWYTVSMVLPISEIDGVKISECEIMLSTFKYTRYRVGLIINIGGFDGDEKEIYYKITPNFKIKTGENSAVILKKWVAIKIKDIREIIKTLRVSPKRNKLTDNFEMENIIWLAYNEFCKELGDRVKKAYDECCICNDITTMQTQCKHHICVVCVSKLNKNKCPLCRGPVYYDTEDDDESSNSETNSEIDEDLLVADADDDDDAAYASYAADTAYANAAYAADTAYANAAYADADADDAETQLILRNQMLVSNQMSVSNQIMLSNEFISTSDDADDDQANYIN